jgi:prolyl oligopeptidase
MTKRPSTPFRPAMRLLQPVRSTRFIVLTAALALSAGPVASRVSAQVREPVRYPPTRTGDQVDVYHGERVADPFRWLEDADGADTKAWVDAQNAVTFGYLGSVRERGAIRDRLTTLWNYPKYTAPFREWKRYFFFENSGLQNQNVLYVRDTRDKAPRVLLDPNTLSTDGTVAVGTVSPSEDSRWLAYSVSSGGSDWQEIRVRDVRHAKDLADTLRWVKFSGMAWTHDHKGFFYNRYDAPSGNALTTENRVQRVYYHRLGKPQSSDQLIYERPDQGDWLFDTQVTDDGQYLILTISKGTDERNRVYFVDLNSPERPRVGEPMVKLIDSFNASYSFIDNAGPFFYFRTDNNAPNGRIVAINIDAPREDTWRTIVPEGKDVMESAAAINELIVVTYLHDAHSVVRFHRPQNGTRVGELDLPGLGSVDGIRGEATDKDFYYTFASYLSPPTVYNYDFKKKKSTLVKAPRVNFDATKYETKQVFYQSKDGTKVPMFITARKGIPLDGLNPTILHGYGGFNIPQTPGFSASTAVWLDMGGVYAVANLRGGGEYGRDWHDGGRLAKKQNTFDDFVAAAEYLIKEKYTSTPKLAISGGSNGGLLVGAVMTQRPELFGAALPAVGVLDMLRFHKFTIGWAWTSDYGSPDDPTQYKTLRAYSPLHNLKPGTRYPATLITTADHDDRVVPAHSFKFAAALQAAQAGPAPVLIRIETRAGHGAGKPTSKRIEEAADRYAFLVRALAMSLSM